MYNSCKLVHDEAMHAGAMMLKSRYTRRCNITVARTVNVIVKEHLQHSQEQVCDSHEMRKKSTCLRRVMDNKSNELETNCRNDSQDTQDTDVQNLCGVGNRVALGRNQPMPAK